MVRTSIEVRTSFKVHPVLQSKYAVSGTGGQFHESVNLGVKILKWPDSHFHILIS